MSKSSGTTRSAGGGCGCISIIVTCLALWALLFGVTYGGKHSDVSCSCNNGVEVEEERR